MKRSRFCCLRLWTLLFITACFNATLAPAAYGAVTLAPVLTGLSSPLYVTNAHDGTNRLFIVEQAGRIKVLAPGAMAPTVFLDIVSKVLSGGEQGLLGLAFHPQFATNSRFFVNYTRQTDGATVIAEYHASADPVVTAASESVILVVAQPFTNHNGGMIEFGNDGFLYIGMGDGGPPTTLEVAARASTSSWGRSFGSISTTLAAATFIRRRQAILTWVRRRAATRFLRSACAIRSAFRSIGRRGSSMSATSGKARSRKSTSLPQAAIMDGGFTRAMRAPASIPASATRRTMRFRSFNTIIRADAVPSRVATSTAALPEPSPSGTYVFGDYCAGTIYSLVNGAPNLLIDTTLNISSFGEDEAREIYVVGSRRHCSSACQSGRDVDHARKLAQSGASRRDASPSRRR